MSNMTRRSFISAAGATGAVAAAAATVAPALADEAAAAATGSWREAPAAPAADQIVETVDVDVVVVGGGSSGLGAARSALRHGVGSVLVIEKGDYSRIGGGVHGVCGSTYADELGIEFTDELIDEMIKDEVKESSMRANERYYRIWAQRSREVFESMVEDFDPEYVHCTNDGAAPYDQLDDEYFSESVYPGEGLQVSSGDVNTPVISGFTDFINNNGGEVRYATRGEQLIVEDGVVKGVYATNADGDYIQINAKAVVISAGGFEGDPEMVAELAPHVIGASCANYMPGTGDGIKMAVWAGAQTQKSPVCTMMSSAKSPDDPNVPNPIPFICVNKNGKRFANEATSSFVIPYAIMNQPDARAWQIFDANYAQTINDLAIQTWMGTIYFDDEKIEAFEEAATKADTLEELAEQMGIDAEGLVATVEKYNQMVENGHDDEFGVPARFIQAVNPVEPPFYGMEIPYNLLVTCGGLICNPETAEVLDADQQAIPGLYATGNSVGERFGMAYTNNMTGLSNGFGDVWGYIAGESAADYIAAL